MNIFYLLILFRERGRKSAPAPGGVALIDARFGVAALRSTPVSPLRICAYARRIYSLISELINCEAVGILHLQAHIKTDNLPYI